MPNAFQQCCEVETAAWDGYLRGFFEARAANASVVKIEKGRLALKLQIEVGDIVLNSTSNGALVAVECKAERKFTGNFFLETWSNRETRRRGWLDHVNADVLAYFFLDVERLYAMNLPRLQDWAFGREPGGGNLHRFRETRQKKQEQHNDTWGRLVPVDVLSQEMPVKVFELGSTSNGYEASDISHLPIFPKPFEAGS